LPKRTQKTKINLETVKFVSNYYTFEKTLNTAVIVMYVVESAENIPNDSSELWYKLIKKNKKFLERKLDLITYRNNTLWALK
jgi:hypothetical protein